MDGHTFAQQAAEQGAVRHSGRRSVAGGDSQIVVPNTRQALAVVSAAYFGHPAEELQVIGLTGTKGKTTISYMVRSILEHAGYRTGLIGTIGAMIGDQVIKTIDNPWELDDPVPALWQMVEAGCDRAVIEASSIG